MTALTREEFEALARKLARDGRLVEAGWIAFRMECIPPAASDMQLSEMRKAFMAGAHHLFFSVVASVDAGDEPTDADMLRMDKIAAELRGFYETELKGAGR